VSGAIVAAAVGSAAATLASLLAYANARAARQESGRANAAGLTASVRGLGQAVGPTEAAIGRVETGVSELCERVACLEGRHDERASQRCGADR
jgi:hypothetical protein